jgi:hypothetical protein
MAFLHSASTVLSIGYFLNGTIRKDGKVLLMNGLNIVQLSRSSVVQVLARMRGKRNPLTLLVGM